MSKYIHLFVGVIQKNVLPSKLKGLVCLINQLILKVSFWNVKNHDIRGQRGAQHRGDTTGERGAPIGERGAPAGKKRAPTGEIQAQLGKEGPRTGKKGTHKWANRVQAQS